MAGDINSLNLLVNDRSIKKMIHLFCLFNDDQWSIVYIDGYNVYISNLYCFLFLKIVLLNSKECRP